jgi:hypothetical protein
MSAYRHSKGHVMLNMSFNDICAAARSTRQCTKSTQHASTAARQPDIAQQNNCCWFQCACCAGRQDTLHNVQQSPAHVSKGHKSPSSYAVRR